VAKKGRSDGEGTVRTRADGTVEARYLIPKEMRPALGGRTYLYFYGRTEREAKRKRSAAEADLIRRGPKALDLDRVTFGEWLERWLDGPLKGSVSEGTYGFYEYRAKTYLVPALGSVRLKDLTAEHLDGLYADLARGKGTPSGKPLSPVTIQRIHATARVALQRAAKKGVIPYNPARDADPPRAEKQIRTTLDLEGVSRFFSAAKGARLEALWIVWCMTGLRPGEILGLKWEDVRLPERPGEEGELIVRRSWSATRTGAYMRETTKTSEWRPVTLLPEAASALQFHRSRYLEELVRSRPVWEAAWREEPKFRDLVFPSTAGTPILHGNLNRQHFKPLLRKAGLPDMRPYDLRHSFATLWIESGEPAEVLQKVLGHSSIKLTIDTYSHLSPRFQRESFGRFGKGLRAGSRTQ
jgi:integrase